MWKRSNLWISVQMTQHPGGHPAPLPMGFTQCAFTLKRPLPVNKGEVRTCQTNPHLHSLPPLAQPMWLGSRSFQLFLPPQRFFVWRSPLGLSVVSPPSGELGHPAETAVVRSPVGDLLLGHIPPSADSRKYTPGPTKRWWEAVLRHPSKWWEVEDR
jgi:hypothetical protein